MALILGIKVWFNICTSINVKGNKSYDDSVHIKKAFDKVQYYFMIKMINKLGREGPFLSIMKAFETSPQLTSYSR